MELDIEIFDVWANRYNFHEVNPNYPNEITECFGISWSCNLGFGECTFHIKHEGEKLTHIYVDDEHMGKDFVCALLDKLKEKIEIEKN